MAKNKSKGVQDTLIPDEITPLQLLPLSAAAGSVKKAASAFRVKASKLLECADKEEYIERYKRIIDEATVLDDLMTYPNSTRHRIMLDDLKRSLDPFGELPTTDDDGNDGGETVDPDTGEIE